MELAALHVANSVGLRCAMAAKSRGVDLESGDRPRKIQLEVGHGVLTP